MSKSGLPVNDIFMLKILLLTGSLISQSCLEFTSPRIGIMYIIWDSHHPHRKRLKGHLDINGFREDVAACRDLQDVLIAWCSAKQEQKSSFIFVSRTLGVENYKMNNLPPTIDISYYFPSFPAFIRTYCPILCQFGEPDPRNIQAALGIGHVKLELRHLLIEVHLFNPRGAVFQQQLP